MVTKDFPPQLTSSDGSDGEGECMKAEGADREDVLEQPQQPEAERPFFFVAIEREEDSQRQEEVGLRTSQGEGSKEAGLKSCGKECEKGDV